MVPDARQRGAEDPMTLFPSESEVSPAGQATSVPAAPVRRLPIGLDTVVARRTPVFWYEGVAIVTGVIVAATTDADSEPQIPGLEGIFIDADGSIAIRRGPGGAEGAATRLARTLHALISAEAIPAALRLLISKWIGSPQGSVPEFASELAYFSRPNPASLIRDVYERCLATVATNVPAQPVPPPPPVVANKAKPKQQPGRRHLVAAGVALSTAAAATAWVAVSSPSWVDVRGLFNLRALTGEADQPTGTDTAQPSDGGGRVAPISPVTSNANNAGEGTAPAPLPARPLRIRQEASGSRTPPPNEPSAFVEMSLPGSGLPVVTSREISSAVVLPAIEVDRERIYSVADPGIEPPSMLYPSLPPAIFGGKGAINSMEVIVSEDGTVERVRLISSPQRMTDMMLLSGAKTWKFAPASANGEPVRYKMVVNWAATP
jgi:hypothetical protein